MARLLLQDDVLLVQLVGVADGGPVFDLTVVKDLARFLVQEKGKLLAKVADGVHIWDLCKDLGEDDSGAFFIL